MINNSIKDSYGNIIGYRCSICDEIKSKMWGVICNACRDRKERAERAEISLNDALSLLNKQSVDLNDLRQELQTLKEGLSEEGNCGNCRWPDGGTCSNCYGLEGTTEISTKFSCKNWKEADE